MISIISNPEIEIPWDTLCMRYSNIKSSFKWLSEWCFFRNFQSWCCQLAKTTQLDWLAQVQVRLSTHEQHSQTLWHMAFNSILLVHKLNIRIDRVSVTWGYRLWRAWPSHHRAGLDGGACQVFPQNKVLWSPWYIDFIHGTYARSSKKKKVQYKIKCTCCIIWYHICL